MGPDRNDSPIHPHPHRLQITFVIVPVSVFSHFFLPHLTVFATLLISFDDFRRVLVCRISRGTSVCPSLSLSLSVFSHFFLPHLTVFAT